MSECFICNRDSDSLFCSHCEPDVCYKCPASDVIVKDRIVYCSHGCEYSLAEYANHKIYTILLNEDPITKLSYAGKRTEVIVPEETSIQSFDEKPSADDSELLLVHYTAHRAEILKNGIEYPPHENAESKVKYNNSVRENAIYGWPLQASYTQEEFTHVNDFVWLRVPRDDVWVSSYRFLEHVGDPSDGKLIPLEKYEKELVFPVECLRKACEKYNRPHNPSNLTFENI